MILWSFLLVGGFLIPAIEGVVLILVALRALKNTQCAVEALIILGFYLLGNRVFTAGLAGSLRYPVLFLSFFSVFFRKKASNVPLRTVLWTFLVLISLSGFLVSYFPSISVLKAVSFFIGAYVLVEGFAQTRKLKYYWFRTINTLFVFILYASLLFLIAGFGYERNGQGFQGILTHPQTFGPVLAPITAWFTGLWISNRKAGNLIKISALLGFAFIYLSQSRTGMLAFLLAGVLAFIFNFRDKKNTKYRKRLINVGVLIVSGFILFAIINPSRVAATVFGFIQKDEETSADISEVFERSRGELTTISIENFKAHPILGIGLGVPSSAPLYGNQFGNVEYLYGIPVSASVEKGFLPTAILEEMGIVGAVLTLLIITVLIFRIATKFSFPMLWVCLSALLINAGEAVFYSLGGPGFFVWLIFGLCYSNDFFQPLSRRIKKVNIYRA